MAVYVPWVYPPPGAVTPPIPLEITTTVLTNGVEDVSFSQALTATGGTAPYTWALSPAVSPNVLPLGMEITSAGVLQGVPTEFGTFPLTFRVTDSLNVTDDSGLMELTIAAAPTGALVVTTTTLPNAKRGTAYTGATLAAAGGTAPYTWALVAPDDVLPTGLDPLNTSTGAITGTPTVQGEWAIKARVTDSVSAQAVSGLLSIIVDQVDAVTITTPVQLTPGVVSAAYTKTFTAAGGYGSITWSKLSGDYPAGSPSFSLTSGGVLTGTPTGAETAVFTLRATDSEGRTADRTFSMAVAASSSGQHAYFDTIAAWPEAFYSRSLRDTAQVNALTSSGTASPTWEYIYGSDTYATPQDGLKLHLVNDGLGSTVGIGKGSIPQDKILRFPAGTNSWPVSGTNANGWTSLIEGATNIIITWDQWWGPEFPLYCGGMTNYKLFGIGINGGSYWTSMNNQGAARNYNVDHPGANIAQFNTDEIRTGVPRAPGVVLVERIQSTAPSGAPGEGTLPQYPNYQAAVPQVAGRWARFWIEIRPAQPYTNFAEWEAFTGATMIANSSDEANGHWWMVSKWIMDEVDDAPRRILYKVPLNWRADTFDVSTLSISHMRFTCDSSKDQWIGPMIGYFRNFCILKNYTLPAVPEDDTALFERPIGGQ